MVLDDSHNRYNVYLNILPQNLKKLPADGFAQAHTLSMQANKSQFLVVINAHGSFDPINAIHDTKRDNFL